MATASQTLDTGRLLAKQRKQKARQNIDQSQVADPAAIEQARQLRYSPKHEGLFKRMFRRSKGSAVNQAKTAVGRVNPSHLATARGLQIAWAAVYGGFASFGVTTIFGLMYLNFHLGMRFVLPSIFAPLGSEWMPLKQRALKTPSKILGALEVIAILLIDILIVGIIVLLITLFVSILESIPEWVAPVLNIIGIDSFVSFYTAFSSLPNSIQNIFSN